MTEWCELCGSWLAHRDPANPKACKQTTCRGCGKQRCMSEGTGNGRCRACVYGQLEGWSHGYNNVCGYAKCGKPAAFSGLPRVGKVCVDCIDRPKITLYENGRSVKVTLRQYLERRR